ncbi:unnamed protein product [Angiostrongylus costaricensis]|uniref:Glycosyltransferase family 92 protein n=1 Tax=Angiostrongylus costaricensis TaxID=334426 RepID=A0A0R3PRF2_ANGCS|nr:unnamed protein product [Angiostrongylus costaricensis]
MFILRFTLSFPVVLLLTLVLVLFLYTSTGFKYIFYTEIPTVPIVEPFELFLISAYYYRTSKSLGNHSIALLLTGDFTAVEELKNVEIVGWSSENNVITPAPIQRITPHKVCRWISMFVTAPLLPNPQGLALSVGNKLVEIPFRAAVAKHYDVVTCITPLFGNEQWQHALLAAHVYRRFGSHMHLYVRSMVSPLYELMKIYENEGYLSIQPWIRITLLTISELQFNPNINVEFGNQAAAQTDCLLQYKESASYIAFMDLDDLLIPRVSNTYLDEFTHLFQSLPNVAYIHYLRENTKLSAARSASELSLSEMLSSIQFDEINETGKLVVDVRYINTTWIHYPVSVAGGMERFDVPDYINVITNLKHMELASSSMTLKMTHIVTSESESRSDVYDLFMPHTIEDDDERPLLEQRHIDEIQSDFERMRNTADLTNILSRLPKSFVYLPVIAKCFEDIFYKYHHSERFKNIKCPGPDRCQFPRGIMCYNSAGWFHSISDGSKFNLHFATDANFVEQDGCRP